MVKLGQRYRIFFFPGIVYRHSLTRFSRILFFFSTFWKKKIQTVFFFFPGKVCSHSLVWEEDNLQKKGQKPLCFAIFSHYGCFFFFFPTFFQLFLFFFFSQEKFKVHSLTRFFGPEKKKQQRKKKKHNFHSLSRFLPKKCKF